MKLRTLTEEELRTRPPQYLIEHLHLRMRCRARNFADEVAEAEIVELSVARNREDIWLLFEGEEKPTGPYGPNEIQVMPPPAPDRHEV